MAKDLEFSAKIAADHSNSARKDEALKRLIDAWNGKNARVAKRAGTFGFMAATLAACGGGDGGDANGGSPVDPVLRLVTGLGVFDATDPVETGGLLSVTPAPDALVPGPVLAGRLTIAPNETYVGDIALFDGGIEVDGVGTLWLLAPAVDGDGQPNYDAENRQTVTLKVTLAGGTLVVDMPSDDYTIVVTGAPGSVDLGGGSLVISDGVLSVDADFYQTWNVGSLVVNSTLELNFRDSLASGEDIAAIVAQISASGSGDIRVLVRDDEQARFVFDGLLGNGALSGADAPAISVLGANGAGVGVDLEKIIDAKIRYFVESLRIEIEGLEAAEWTEGDLNTLKKLSDALRSLQSVVDANDAAQTSALAAAQQALNGMVSELSGRVTTEVTRLEDAIAAGDTATATAIGAVAGDLAALTAAVAALTTTVGDNDAAQTAALAAEGARLEGLITALTATVTAEVTRLEGVVAAGDAANAQAIGVVADDLAALTAAVAALTTTVGDNDTAQTAALAAEGARLEGLITALTATVTAEVTRLEGVVAAGDTATATAIGAVAGDLAALTAMVGTLAALVDANDAAQTSALAAAQQALNGMVSELSGRVTTEVTRLEDAIAAGDTATATAIGAVAGDLAALTATVGTLAALVDANDAAQTAALAAEGVRLEGLITALTATVTAEVARLEGVVAAGDAANAAAIGAVAGDLAALTATVGTLAALVGANDAAQAAALTAEGARLEGLITALTATVTAEVTRLEDAIAAGDTANATAIGVVADDLAALTAAVAALTTTVGDNDAAQTAALAAEGARLEGLITALTATVTAEVTRLEGVIAAGDTANATAIGAVADDLAALTAAVAALTTTVGDNATAASQALAAAQQALTARLDALEATLAGLTAQPEDWGNKPAVTVTAAEIFGDAEGGSSTTLTGFTADFAALVAGYDPATIPLEVTTPLTVARAVALAQAGFDMTNVTYSISGGFTTVQAALADPAGSAALAGATEVVITGNEAPNIIDLSAFGPSVNVRVEAGGGADTIVAGTGAITVEGGRGADTIWLSDEVETADTVVYSSLCDGVSRAILTVDFPAPAAGPADFDH